MFYKPAQYDDDGYQGDHGSRVTGAHQPVAVVQAIDAQRLAELDRALTTHAPRSSKQLPLRISRNLFRRCLVDFLANVSSLSDV